MYCNDKFSIVLTHLNNFFINDYVGHTQYTLQFRKVKYLTPDTAIVKESSNPVLDITNVYFH